MKKSRYSDNRIVESLRQIADSDGQCRNTLRSDRDGACTTVGHCQRRDPPPLRYERDDGPIAEDILAEIRSHVEQDISGGRSLL